MAARVKVAVEDLAIRGGSPQFAAPLHVGRPNIGNRERLRARIDDMLDRRWLTNNGPFVQELELQISHLLGVRHCIAVCNATVALEIAARALQLKGEVIVPSFTFIATAHALHWQGITPVFCDVDPATHNLDPRRVEELVSSRTSGIVGVHVWGRPCAVEALTDIAIAHRLRLMFDAAHAFANSYKGRMIGGFGDVEVFSFHATKFFNTFEGGLIATNDDELATKMHLMTNFGFEGYDRVIHLGTNGKMSEISAAMGLTGLESLQEFIGANRENYQAYHAGLHGLPGIKLIQYDETERCNYQYVVLEVNEEEAGIDRDSLVDILHRENVLARRYFYPGCHEMEPYRSRFPEVGLRLPETNRLTRRVMSLPTGTAVDGTAVAAICRIIELSITHSGRLRDALRPAQDSHSSQAPPATQPSAGLPPLPLDHS